MKLNDLRNQRPDRMSESELKEAHQLLKSVYNRTTKAFTQKGMRPFIMEATETRLSEIPRGIPEFSRLQAEVSAMRSFFFTTPPGRVTEERTRTSTVGGYKQVLKEQGRNLGIKGYEKWNEDQRKDLWAMIDRVRELGPDRFMPAGFGNALYQSGTSFQTISVLVNELQYDDPVQILEALDQRINAVELGNTMTDREFFGV